MNVTQLIGLGLGLDFCKQAPQKLYDTVAVLHRAVPQWFTAAAEAEDAVGNDWRRLDAVVRLLWPALTMDELADHFKADRLVGLAADECVDFLHALWSDNAKRNWTEKLLRSSRKT